MIDDLGHSADSRADSWTVFDPVNFPGLNSKTAINFFKENTPWQRMNGLPRNP